MFGDPLVSYQKIRVILEHAKETDSLPELIKKVGESPAFLYGKSKKILIRRQRKQYIDRCVKLGLLNDNYQLTDLGHEALENFDGIMARIIFNLKVNGKNFKEVLYQALANIDIPIVERIKEKLDELNYELPVQQLRNYLNILAKSGILQKNRKYTYTLAKLDVKDFEAILRAKFDTMEKDPTGTVWFEQYKEDILKHYSLTPTQFDELFAELKKRRPGLISLQRARTKSWFKLREV